ncbi:hypothetical protein PSYMO_37901, partial [Pseudomonas amygdali pv. mori str. 301020]
TCVMNFDGATGYLIGTDGLAQTPFQKIKVPCP